MDLLPNASILSFQGVRVFVCQHQGQLNEQFSLRNRQKPLNRVWRGHTVADYPETKLLKSQIIDLKDLKSLIFSTDNFDNSSVSKLKPKCQIFRQSKESQFWFFQSKLFLKSNGSSIMIISVRNRRSWTFTKKNGRSTLLTQQIDWADPKIERS